MKPKHLPFLSLLVISFLLSCKPSKESQIVGLWQEVSVRMPEMEEAMERQRQFLDTVGSRTDSATNASLYGTTNIDSFKKDIRTNMDSLKRAQDKAISETWFDFHKNGLVYLHSEEGLDSAKWYFEEDALILDEEKLKGGGARLRMEVEVLNDTALQLRYTEKYISSIAGFRRVKR